MSKFNINIDNSVEQDQVFLCNRNLEIIGNGELHPIDNLKIKFNLNSNNEVSFKIYKYSNGNLNPLWNELDDLAIILVKGKGYFELRVPKTTEDCTFKDISGISLCEAETGQTNITIQINTEDDIARDDYVPTVLYNPDNVEGSALHRIFKSMPHYSIGHVDESVASMQRTFSCEDKSVYDFLQEIAEELECIFIFDDFSRTVNCYKLDDYGKDSGVFISGEKLSESITVTGDVDSVKNCFKIEGGDDEITNRIGNRLIGGNRIWTFSSYQMGQMSETLRNALTERESLVQSYQEEYNNLWDNYNTLKEKEIYYESGMMPSEKTDETTAKSVFEEIFGDNGKITYGCTSNKYQGSSSVLKSISNFAKVIAPSTYTVELTEVSSTKYEDDNSIASITFTAHVYLTNRYEKNENGIEVLEDEYTSDNITLPVKKGYNLYASDGVFTTDYYLYLKQQMEIAEAKSDITDEVISFDPPLTDPSYDNEENPNNYSSIHYSIYCINRLQSFYDAYEACSQVLAEMNSNIASDTKSLLKYIKPNGSNGNIYDDLLGKYSNYMKLITSRINYLQEKVNKIKSQADENYERISEIRDICDMQSFLEKYEDGIHGDKLWIELCAFRREDTYKNDNYIAEDLDEKTIIENIEGLIKQAEIEIAKACEIHYSITTTLGNLLTMREFEPFWDNFELGNYIHIRIDEEIYRLRLISITYNYDDIAHIEVEFSEFTKSKNCVNDLRQVIQQSKSMASSFNFVARQAEKGHSANSEIADMRKNGLDIANTMITDASNQEFLMNQYGITGRKWDDISETYEPEQSRWINNLLCFTDDAWEHTKCALGKICYYDDEKGEYVYDYGLNAGALIADLVLSNKMKIVNQSGTYVMDDNGFEMKNGKKYIKFEPNKPSIVANDGTQNVLDFNSDGEGNFEIRGDIKGGSININENFIVDKDGNAIVNIVGGNVNIETDTTSDDGIVFNYKTKETVYGAMTTVSMSKSGFEYAVSGDTRGSSYITYHYEHGCLIEDNTITMYSLKKHHLVEPDVDFDVQGTISLVIPEDEYGKPLPDKAYFQSSLPIKAPNIT